MRAVLIIQLFLLFQAHSQLMNKHSNIYAPPSYPSSSEAPMSSQDGALTLKDFGNGLWDCAVGVGQGAVDSVVDTAKDAAKAAEAAWDCFWAPIDCAGKAYDAVKEGIAGIGEMASGMMNTLSNLGPILSAIPSKVIIDTACKTSGSVLVSLVKGAAGVRNLIPNVLGLFAKTLPKLAKIAKTLGGAASSILTKINKLGEEQMDKVQNILERLQKDRNLSGQSEFKRRLDACTI